MSIKKTLVITVIVIETIMIAIFAFWGYGLSRTLLREKNMHFETKKKLDNCQ